MRKKEAMLGARYICNTVAVVVSMQSPPRDLKVGSVTVSLLGTHSSRQTVAHLHTECAEDCNSHTHSCLVCL